MTTAEDSLRERLSRQPTLIGLLQMRPNPLLIEIAGECGYDFLILDGQLGRFSESDFFESLTALVDATELISMVRLAGHDLRTLNQCLEKGANTVVVPKVTTAQEASTLARAMRSNTRTSLIVILESALGATNAKEILVTEGVAGAFVGPVNLSKDLGHPGNYAHPLFLEALARIEHAAAVTGKVLGTVPHKGYSMRMLIARGHRLFILDSDQTLLKDAMRDRVTQANAT